MLQKDQIVVYDRKKYFKFIKSLGSGGTGDTSLFEDITTKILFAFKKYVPKGTNDPIICYKRFVEEIIILHRISHPNIVRIYNYYLYPEMNTGYLQMEYIQGTTIDKYYDIDPSNPKHPKDINSIFIELINAFQYLEKIKILHRDIRPSNIMIDQDDNVKVIDFGFGKEIDIEQNQTASVFLEMPTKNYPEEIIIYKRYSVSTEIYYLGKLFEDLINNNHSLEEKFEYNSILKKMIKQKESDRFTSFVDISAKISENYNSREFSDSEKRIYITFADNLMKIIHSITDEIQLELDNDQILNNLKIVIHDNMLEEFIQDHNKLIRCFIKSHNYSYYQYPKERLLVKSVVEFNTWINKKGILVKNIVFDNIRNRLSRIKIDYYDDLPF